MKNFKAGLDVGSTSAKLVVLLPPDFEHVIIQSDIFSLHTLGKQTLLVSKAVKVMGKPRVAVQQLLADFWHIFPQVSLQLAVTGSQAKLVASLLNISVINEFKAIAWGAVQIEPQTQTIMEIGGDGSRFLHIQYDAENNDLAILDYNRNGECAAGTGSFIDQQAVRLKYEIEEIGDLVLGAENSANIAGRCSVFAKSDMIHAQQRGYSSAAILKGLCEAVVRNYKATIVRGKPLHAQTIFIGGVAANAGVVQVVQEIFQIDNLLVPSLFQHVGAIGCAILADAAVVDASAVQTLSTAATIQLDSVSLPLSTQNVRFENQHTKFLLVDASAAPVPAYLGIDIGSVSTNLVLLDADGNVLDSVYTQTEGKPVQVVQRELLAWQQKWQDQVKIQGVGTTGSGRELIGELVGADIVNDEITAHKTGAGFIAKNLFDEPVDTIFEIGGQDSKFISIENGVVVDFTMNEACAAGTGSFLEEQATKMGIPIKEKFAELALAAESPLRLGERCTVFMEKDVTAFMQQGRSLEEICAGLSYAVVQNYLNRVVRDRKIGDYIYFQGGTAYNRAVAAAFATVLGKKVTVPPHNGVMGAIGAALLAKEKMQQANQASTFRGFDLSHVEFATKQFTCKGCSNTCEIQRITIDGEHSYWGDKCSDRYRKKAKTLQRPILPNLVNVYNELLLENYHELAHPDARIGVPRSMYYYDRFPFWQAYFSQLNIQVVLSDETHGKLAAQGRDLCIAEPCFPIVVGHGHLLDVLDKNVDYAFMPISVNSETETPETFSWYCPWGQTLPIVIHNSLQDEAAREKMLMPIFRFRLGMEHVQERLHPIAEKLGVSLQQSDAAVVGAYAAQNKFNEKVQQLGRESLAQLQAQNKRAILLVGRPYNVFDAGVNLSIPEKLYEHYGMNVLPMPFLPLTGIRVDDLHANMFWNYGRKILQACRFASQQPNLHVIYFTNFKCGPDSYIKHFVPQAVQAPYLTLQFDGHSNDAGFMTRCEAYLQSKNLLTF